MFHAVQSAIDPAVPVWRGYLPWAELVMKSRREFVRVVRRFWIIPEIIPARDREDIGLLYCVCRQLDDAVDEAASPQQARAALASFRAELEGKIPPRPLIAAFLAGAAKSGMPLDCMQLLLDGMESDLGSVRIADDEALIRYAYRVSAAVGMMLAPLLGIRSREGVLRVVDLGIALQLSNAIFGVADDAKRDRVYLPADRLAAAGVDAARVLEAPDDPRLRSVLQGLTRLADRYYESAEQGASLFPLRYRHGVLLVGRAYRELGIAASSRGETPATSTTIPLEMKARSLLAVLATAWTPRTLGLTSPPAHDASLHRGLAGWPGTDPNPATRGMT